MKSRALIVAAALVLVLTVDTRSQTSVSCDHTAVVLEFKGTCSCRTGTEEKEIREHIGLQGGQELQCKRESLVTFRFCRSRKEKTISENDPEWYTLPNVPSPKPRQDP